ncbi:MAG: hypothetical protein AB7F40_00290 [Victivallaceae bacterium]
MSEDDKKRWLKIAKNSKFTRTNFDKFQHFVAGAMLQANGGMVLAIDAGFYTEVGDQFKRWYGQITNTLEPYQIGFDSEDFYWTGMGAILGDKFDTWLDTDCRDFVDRFINKEVSLSNYFPALK